MKESLVWLILGSINISPLLSWRRVLVLLKNHCQRYWSKQTLPEICDFNRVNGKVYSITCYVVKHAKENQVRSNLEWLTWKPGLQKGKGAKGFNSTQSLTNSTFTKCFDRIYYNCNSDFITDLSSNVHTVLARGYLNQYILTHGHRVLYS